MSATTVTTPSSDPLRQELKRLFFHDDFRAGQREIVEGAVNGVDTLAVLPTGGGKSLTYQLPAMLVPGATLVLSPLIALMKDQAENLPPEVAARSTIINSSLDPSEVGRRLSMVKAGRIKMVYAAPERLRQPPFLHALRRANVSLVVVDEAHCISQWGHDFRPDYRAVGKAVEALNPRSVLAVTATATPEVQSDIERQLGRTTHRIVRATYRDNLFLSCQKVQGEDEKLWATLEICRDTPGAGLVYAGSREKCEQLSRMLKRHGVAAGFYHAGLPPEERAAAQDRFMSGEVRVMAATVAFGMGVDKSDIRFLVHYHPSRTLENYYQEAGRAGRDGKPSFCTLLFSSADGSNATRHLREGMITLDHIKAVYGAVRQSVGAKRIAPLAWEDLFRAVGGDEGLVRSALPLLEESGLIARHIDLPRTFSIHPDFSGQGTEDGMQDVDWDTFAPALHGGGEFDPRTLSAETGVPLPQLEETLLRFQDAGYLTYRAAPRQMLLELLPAPPDTRQRMEATLAHRATGQDERGQSMRAYAKDLKCRHGQIARYFGDRWPNLPCGMCDVCVKKGKTVSAPSSSIPQPASWPAEKAPIAALQIVQDLAQGYRPFAIGKAGLLKALRGTPDAPIKRDRTSAFGALGDYKKSDVDRLIEALLEQGYFRRDDDDEFRRLYLTREGSRAVSSGEADVEWRVASLSTGAAVPRSSRVAADLPEGVDAVLLETLKSWRRELAQADNLPPYVIFHDSVLNAVATNKPANEFDLLEIPKVGPKRVAQYGDAVLEMVRRHREG